MGVACREGREGATVVRDSVVSQLRGRGRDSGGRMNRRLLWGEAPDRDISADTSSPSLSSL